MTNTSATTIRTPPVSAQPAGCRSRLAVAVLLAAAFQLASAPSAQAELVFLKSGRSLSVKAYHVEGPSIILTLRAGGEITCDRTLIDRIAPDEVPYPEPEPAPAPVARTIIPTSLTPGGPAPFADMINAASAEHGVNARLIRAVIQVESAYQPRARSNKGAMGLMQLMPGTARQYAVSDPYDPQANIRAGVRHLKSLMQRFELSLALAAYNSGEATIQKFGGIPPYRETRAYVARVLQLSGLATRN